MKTEEPKSTDLTKMKNFLDYNQKVKVEDKTFQKLMFIYEMAIKELEVKIDIINKEFKIFYDYDLIDHVNTRIKKLESMLRKMKAKECVLTYKNMIENINDIAGVRIICPLKKDIYSIKNLLQKLPRSSNDKRKRLYNTS